MTTRSSVANSPASIRLARSTSWAAVRSGTLPISFRYIRTGSFVGAFRRSTSSCRCALASTSSPGTSMTSMPSPRRCSSTWERKSSTCSGVKSSTGTASRRSSEVTKPRSRPRAVICSFASSRPRSRATFVNAAAPSHRGEDDREVYGTERAVTRTDFAPPKRPDASRSEDGRTRLRVHVSPLAEPAELAVGGDELLEQPVVSLVGRRVHLLELLAEPRALAPQRELSEPGEHVVRVARDGVALERFERERAQRTPRVVVLGVRDARPNVAAGVDELP